MPLDRLDALLQRFSRPARVFHTGALCGTNDFDDRGMGYLHLLRRGPLTIHNPRGKTVRLTEPSILFYPVGMNHRFVSDRETGADLACASVQFAGGMTNPIVQSLPPFTAIPISSLPNLAPALDLLFAEAFCGDCGRQAALNRLFEVVIIQVLRFAMTEGRTSTGMLAGLADPRLARAIVAASGSFPSGEATSGGKDAYRAGSREALRRGPSAGARRAPSRRAQRSPPRSGSRSSRGASAGTSRDRAPRRAP